MNAYLSNKKCKPQNEGLPFFNKKYLQKAGLNIKLPLSLSLEHSEGLLQCDKLLRIVPGSRAVFLGKWGTKQVVAKLFYKPLRIRCHLKREMAGTKRLLKAGILTPDLLYTGNVKNTSIGILLYEYILPDIHLKEELKAVNNTPNNRTDKLDLICRFMMVIAGMHQEGLKQEDLHLNNFLVKNHTIYSIDVTTIKQSINGRALKVRESLNNLALFFYQIKLHDTPKIREIYSDYVKARGWKETDKTFEELLSRIKKVEKKTLRIKLKKIFRESTGIICRKTFSRFLLCVRTDYTSEMAAFLDDPDSFLDGSESRVPGKGASIIKINKQELVVKRHDLKGHRQRIRSCFVETPAAYSWRNAHRLLSMDIPTFRPIALLERKFGPFRSTTYFISEYIADSKLKDL